MLNDAPNGGDSGAMPCDAGQPAPCGPAAVAVHDDGHMQFFVNVTLHSTATSQNVALRVPSPAGLCFCGRSRRQTMLCHSFLSRPCPALQNSCLTFVPFGPPAPFVWGKSQ